MEPPVPVPVMVPPVPVPVIVPPVPVPVIVPPVPVEAEIGSNKGKRQSNEHFTLTRIVLHR